MRKLMIALVAATLAAGCSSGEGPAGAASAPSGAKGAASASAPKAAAHKASAAAAGDLDRAALAQKIKRYYEATGGLPADVKLEVTELGASTIPGLRRGTLRLSRGSQSQDMAFLLSENGRWFLQADPVDLSVDPIARIRDTIKIGEDDASRGKQDAAVTIVEYSDFQCPFCARAEKIVNDELLPKYGDRVRFVYKQFPLTSIHPWAERASLIGLCVLKRDGQEAYWKYHGSVFAKQREIKPADATDALLDLAAKAGADRKAVKACFDAGETKPLIAATAAEAEDVGVDSTPTFFINGRKLSGAQPLQAFEAILEPELSRAGRG